MGAFYTYNCASRQGGGQVQKVGEKPRNGPLNFWAAHLRALSLSRCSNVGKGTYLISRRRRNSRRGAQPMPWSPSEARW